MNKPYGWIYKITNAINGKVYIGLTTEGFDKRYYGRGIIASRNRHLQNAIKKYGVEAFVVDKEWDIAYNKEELDDLEKYWIYLYDARNSKYGYNIQSGGHNGKPSAETKRKTSESMKKWHKEIGFTEEQRKSISERQQGNKNSFYGHKHTDEQKNKWSEQRKGTIQNQEWKRKNSEGVKKYYKEHPQTDEQRHEKSVKMKEWHKKHKHPKSKTIKCNNDGMIFESCKSACEYYGLSRSEMCNHLKGKRKSMTTKNGIELFFQYV